MNAKSDIFWSDIKMAVSESLILQNLHHMLCLAQHFEQRTVISLSSQILPRQKRRQGL